MSNGLVPVKKGVPVNQALIDKINAKEQANSRENGTLSPIPNGFRDVKEKPSDPIIRRKHTGREAYDLIARRILVGISKLNESGEVAIFDDHPVPPGNYAVRPLSLNGNADGSASLMVNDLTTRVLYQANLIVGNVSTPVPVVPKISIENTARSMFIQNTGASAIYVTFDGTYDPQKNEEKGATAPATGVGQLLQGNGTLNNAHLLRTNPRLISPSGNQTVNVVILG